MKKNKTKKKNKPNKNKKNKNITIGVHCTLEDLFIYKNIRPRCRKP